MKTYKDESTPNDVIATRRSDLGITQAELAKKLDLKSANFITILEKGRSQVPLERAPDLAKALEMDPKWFTRMVLEYRYPDVSEVLFED